MWTIGWEALETLECQSPLACSFLIAPSLLESLLVPFLLPTLKQRHPSCILLLSSCSHSRDEEVHMDFSCISRLWLLSLKNFSSSTLCPHSQIHLPNCLPDISFWMLLWFGWGLIPQKLIEIWFLMMLKLGTILIPFSQKLIFAAVSCYMNSNSHAVSSCHGCQLAPTPPPHWDGTLQHSYRMSAPCSWTPEPCANTNLHSWYTSQVFCYSNVKQTSICILEISHLMAFKLDPDFSQLSLSLKSTPLCCNHILGTAQVRTISIILD